MSRACAAALLLMVGCASPGPVSGELSGHHPVLLPAQDRLVWFLCRWPQGTLRVRLHGAGDPSERERVALALAAWERERLGIRFDVATGEAPADLEIWIHDEPPPTGSGRSALGSAECDLSQGIAAARLVRGRVDISRKTGPDWRGQQRPLEPAEQLGSLIHEIGHALGFAGHARRADDPMAAAPEVVRHAGQRALAGSAIDARSLRALYGDPRMVVARVPVPSGRTDPFDTRAAEAEALGWRGPFVRVGERSARIRWRDDAGTVADLLVPRLRNLLRDPESLLLVPMPR